MAGKGRIAAVSIKLTDEERVELESLSRRRKTAQGLARRARIVLLASDGVQNQQIAAQVGATPTTVGKWRRRFAERRCDGLFDEPRSGTPRKIGDDAIAETIRRTLEETPPGATHWSLRSMAGATGYAPSTIHRIWKAFGLQPHRTETFKLSTDPLFVEKVRDIVCPHATLRFDTSKPDGTPRKMLDVTKLKELGWSPSIPLDDGIRSTYEWFLEQEADHQHLRGIDESTTVSS